MTGTGPEADDLRRAMSGAAESGTPAPGCPDPESFWEAQRGTLPPAETREGALEGKTTARPAAAGWNVAVAAAAVLLVAAGLVFLVPPGGRDGDVIYRSGRSVEIESTLPEGRPLPREDFLLRWTPGPEGTVYRVDVTTESFEAVAAVDGLAATEWRVPERALAGVGSGSRLYWRVEGLPPDGRPVRSETFVVTLE